MNGAGKCTIRHGGPLSHVRSGTNRRTAASNVRGRPRRWQPFNYKEQSDA